MERSIAPELWHSGKRWLAVLALALPTAFAAQPKPLELAWLSPTGQVQTRVLQDGFVRPSKQDAHTLIQLGSLWKLVAYAQWAESRVPEAAYRCVGRKKDEVYCCQSGESIDRATALVRSCGLYFSSERVPWAVSAGPAISQAPASIAAAIYNRSLGPQTEVALGPWLQWLAAWPRALKEQAQADLLGYWLQGAGTSALAQVGSQLRVKTFTREGQGSDASVYRVAGASGWAHGAIPVWFSGAGTSALVVPQVAKQVLATLATDAPIGQASLDGACVHVAYFARYPIEKISPLGSAQLPATGSALKGAYRVLFQSGQSIDIQSQGELRWQASPSGPRIEGELPLDEYVARVLDREASPEPAQAAWALAVAARSYVLTQGESARGCTAIADSSRTQRVAPRPASAGARSAAAATSGLVLRGGYAVMGQYHQNKAADGILSWASAVQQARSGGGFTDILTQAYPKASVASAYAQGVLACEALPSAEQWLAKQRRQWQALLSAQAGYADPGAVQICRLSAGRPHARAGTQRIDVSGFQTLEERIAIAHEYLHLAFARHPNSRDEDFIESLARRLIGV